MLGRGNLTFVSYLTAEDLNRGIAAARMALAQFPIDCSMPIYCNYGKIYEAEECQAAKKALLDAIVLLKEFHVDFFLRFTARERGEKIK